MDLYNYSNKVKQKNHRSPSNFFLFGLATAFPTNKTIKVYKCLSWQTGRIWWSSRNSYNSGYPLGRKMSLLEETNTFYTYAVCKAENMYIFKNLISYYNCLFCFNLISFISQGQAQGLMHARQVLYYSAVV